MIKDMSKKTMLMILDGWGIAQNKTFSAIDNAKTPFIDSLYDTYNHATLRTDGLNVGLPEGQMGNSEVGHINLGAGRIVYQNLAKINKSIKEDTLKENKVLNEAFAYAIKNNKKVHFLGLVSDGGVHSHINHLSHLLKLAKSKNVKDFYVHAFTDGRDVDPKSSVQYFKQLEKDIENCGGKLASVIGRYYAMDRDQRWERVKKAYDLIVNGVGEPTLDFISRINEVYKEDITDEFLPPMIKSDENGNKIASQLHTDDVVIFFNFRTDRGRQLTQVLCQKDFDEFDMKKLPLHYVTMTKYDDNFKNVKVLFDNENLTDTLGEVLAKNKKTQVRIAETEKYPHVTFFFNGGRETPFDLEKRILCPSPKVATYDLKPEMSAYEVKDSIIEEINKNTPDFICLNFANPDMVGHTGSMDAAIKACESVDKCAEEVIHNALNKDYSILLIADHGNCETMQNEDGSPNTAHTTNPVPLIFIDKEKRKVANGILGNIAPTILDILNVEKPKAMTEETLLIK